MWVVSGDYKRAPDPDVHTVRAGPLRHVHHRVDIRAADLPVGSRRHGHRRSAGVVGREPRGGPRLGALLLHAGKAQRVLAELSRVTDRRVSCTGPWRPTSRCIAPRRADARRRRRSSSAPRLILRRRARSRAALRRAARRGCAASARSPTRSRPARCASAVSDVNATSTGASCCPTMRTGPIALGRSTRVGAAASSPRTATPEPLARYLRLAGNRQRRHPDRLGVARQARRPTLV